MRKFEVFLLWFYFFLFVIHFRFTSYLISICSPHATTSNIFCHFFIWKLKYTSVFQCVQIYRISSDKIYIRLKYSTIVLMISFGIKIENWEKNNIHKSSIWHLYSWYARCSVTFYCSLLLRKGKYGKCYVGNWMKNDRHQNGN